MRRPTVDNICNVDFEMTCSEMNISQYFYILASHFTHLQHFFKYVLMSPTQLVFLIHA